MSSDATVNYLGDSEILNKEEVKLISDYVVNNKWKYDVNVPEKIEIDINVISDREITQVNNKYLDKNRATDVIAFSFCEGEKVPAGPRPNIGQILISIDSAKRQAKELKHSLREEMLILLIHALLHISGWEEGEEIQDCQEEIRKILETQI